MEQDKEEKSIDAADTPEPALMAEASLRPCPAAKEEEARGRRMGGLDCQTEKEEKWEGN